MDLTLDLKSIITFIAICVAILIAYFSNFWRNRKSLSYEVISNTPLLSSNELIRERLQILYDDVPVKNVHLLVLKIINDGKQPITGSDFIKPLSFKLPEQSNILSFETLSLKPENLDVELNFSENNLYLKTDLLNSYDSITLKIIASSYDFELTADARIVGVKEIKRINSNVKSVKRVYGSLIGFVIICLLLSIFLLQPPLNIYVPVLGILIAMMMFYEVRDFVKKFTEIEKGKFN